MNEIMERDKKWAELLEQERLLQLEKEKILLEWSQKGWILADGQWTLNEPTWGIEWEFDYYSRYVGEVGAMYDRYFGSALLSDEQYSEAENALLNEDEDWFVSLFERIAGVQYYVLDKLFQTGRWTSETGEDGEIGYIWERTEDHGQQSLDVGSYFRIRRMTKRETIDNPADCIEKDFE